MLWSAILAPFVCVVIVWGILYLLHEGCMRLEGYGQRETDKLLAAHEADPLQEELNRYQELRRLIPEKERELVALKQEQDTLEARRAGTYREPAHVISKEEEREERLRRILFESAGGDTTE